ncbi:17933_t:CDS:2 [Acaulospora morrowiae]|uniref:17933_t:CDS:1 n=1 Tax=Acaulospora morrowiae TaxID=94023 RepID=A0A9N9C3S5_9GLOM|nr:17933_t:CDS:2 [Acaulospora morrowiae]
MDVGQFRFLDSFQHMEIGLNKLVETFGGKLEKLPLSVKHFTEKGYSLDQINLLIKRKGDDGLDPSHYVSAPGMFNDSLYKSSGVKIKLMSDMDEYLTEFAEA